MTPQAAAESAPLPAQTWPIALRHAMQRVADVEWRLHEAAGQRCPVMAPATGIVTDSLDAYDGGTREEIARILGMTDLVQVAAVAAGSPAAAAGIVPGDAIETINGRPSGAADTAPGKADTAALRAMALMAALPAGQSAQFTLSRGGKTFSVSLTPPLRCAARIYVNTDNALKAYSDGVNMAMTARIVDFTQSQDELAIIAGHELAHAIAEDDGKGGMGRRRAMEDRADAIGTDLAACAGYDPRAGALIWQRWEKTIALRFLGFQQARGKERTRRAQQRPFPASCPITGIPPLSS